MGAKTKYSLELTPREKEIEYTICELGIINYIDLMVYFHITKPTLDSHLKSIYAKRGVNCKCGMMWNYYKKQTSQKPI